MTPFPRWLLTTLLLVFLLFGAVRALGAETVAGTIKSIDLNKRVLVLIDDEGPEWTFHLATDVKVRPGERERNDLETLFSASPAFNAPAPAETLFVGTTLAPRVEYDFKLTDLRVGDRV